MKLGSSNPVFRSVRANAIDTDSGVTYAGVTLRTIYLILVASGVGVYTYLNLAEVLNMTYLFAAMILGFISVLVGTRSAKLSPYFATLYAVCEGYILGFVSGFYAYLYEGIIPTAILTTIVVLLVTLLIYSTKMIKVTSRFASFLVVGLISVIIMSLISLFVPFSGPFYIFTVLLSAVLSVLFLFYDIDNINTCVESGTDKSYSFVLALGLMVTIVWVYMEVLRILAIFARDR